MITPRAGSGFQGSEPRNLEPRNLDPGTCSSPWPRAPRPPPCPPWCYLTATLNYTTIVRVMTSPKMCCWMVWFAMFVPFSATAYRPSFHFVPMVKFTDVYGSV